MIYVVLDVCGGVCAHSLTPFYLLQTFQPVFWNLILAVCVYIHFSLCETPVEFHSLLVASLLSDMEDTMISCFVCMLPKLIRLPGTQNTFLKRLKWESMKMPFHNQPWKAQKALLSSSMDCSAMLRIFLSNLLVRSILITHRGVLWPTTVRGKWGSPWGSVPVWRCGGVLMLRRLHHGGF